MVGPGSFLQRLWWQVPRWHLSEDHLLALALGTTGESPRTAAAATYHLRVCGPCKCRFNALETLLKTMPQVADASFEEVYTPQRLQTQRARIGHRLAHLVGKVEPARVLAFPFSGQPLKQFDFRPGRWFLATAAAGLLLGVTAGQLIHYHPVTMQTETRADFDRPAGTLDMTGTVELPLPDGTSQAQTFPLTLDEFERLMAEEEFLGNLELALTSFQVSELESIDALTPRVRDFSINIR